jgi:hypothetical protein
MNETVIGTMALTTRQSSGTCRSIEENRLAGIVSIGDVMKWRLEHTSPRGLPWHRQFCGGPDRGDGEGHALTLEEAMAEAARRVAPHSPNSVQDEYRPAPAAL